MHFRHADVGMFAGALGALEFRLTIVRDFKITADPVMPTHIFFYFPQSVDCISYPFRHFAPPFLFRDYEGVARSLSALPRRLGSLMKTVDEQPQTRLSWG
jgi:hypothetical protein